MRLLLVDMWLLVEHHMIYDIWPYDPLPRFPGLENCCSPFGNSGFVMRCDKRRAKQLRKKLDDPPTANDLRRYQVKIGILGSLQG